MTVNLTRIYTRLGDDGETHLGDMSRVPKTHPRIEAYGTVDELNAQLGARARAGRSARALRRRGCGGSRTTCSTSAPTSRSRTAATASGCGCAPEQTAWLEQALRRGQRRRCRAAEVVRAPRRHAGGGAAARLPHGLPARRAPHDRLRRRGQRASACATSTGSRTCCSSSRAAPTAATSRCGSRGATGDRPGPVPAPSTARCGSCTPSARQLGGHWWRLGDTPRRRARDGAAATAPRVARSCSPSSRSAPPSDGLHGVPGGDRRVGGWTRACAAPPATSCSSATRRCASRCSTSSTSTTLLAYLAALADSAATTRARRLPPRLGDADRRGARRRPRTPRSPLADDPERRDRARRRLARSAAPATSAAIALGTLGEAIDGSPVGKAARKVRRNQ